MGFWKSWLIFGFLVLLQEAAAQEPLIWELTDSMKQPLGTATSATSFARFGGELAYVEGSTLYIGDKTATVPFKSVRKFIKYNDAYYICPGDDNAKLYKISSSMTDGKEIDSPKTTDPTDSAKTGVVDTNYWIDCFYNKTYPALFVSFNGYQDIVPYLLDKDEWSLGIASHGIFDDSKYIKSAYLYDNHFFYLHCSYENSNWMMYLAQCKLNQIPNLGIFSCSERRNIKTQQNWVRNGRLEAGFYIELGNEDYNRILYSFWDKKDGNIRLYGMESYESNTNQVNVGDYTGNYNNKFGPYDNNKKITGRPISGTNNFAVQAETSSKKYWGVIDFKYYNLIFLSEDSIDTEVYPVNEIIPTGNSIVIKENGKLKTICLTNGDPNKIAECPACNEGELTIIDNVMGNQCFAPPSGNANGFQKKNNVYTCGEGKQITFPTGACAQCKGSQVVNIKYGTCLEKCKGQMIGKRCKHCKDYNQYFNKDSGQCEDVPKGYYVNDDNEKVECESSCATCSNGDGCDLCKDGFAKIATSTFCVPCYFLCKTCSVVGNDNNHQCSSCIEGSLSLEGTNCKPTCSKYWFLEESTNEVQCTDPNNCSAPNPVLKEETKQCIQSCKSIGRYQYNEKCVTSCPSGYEANTSTYVCDKKKEPSKPSKPSDDEDDENDPELEKCVLLEVELDDFDINSDIQGKAQELVKEYLKQDGNEYLVEVIRGNKVKMTIYKKSKCANKFSKEKGISYANLSGAQDKLADANGMPRDSEFIIGQIEMAREDQVTDQLSGYIIANNLGEPYDLKPIADETVNITHPISVDQLKFYQRAKTLAELGVDVYNPADPFFNDLCYPYTDEEGRDVTIKDRRENIFQNGSFCEEECDYRKMDFKNARVTCECKVNPSIFDKIFQNGDASDFPIKLNLNNLIVVRCYNLVFSSEYFPTNAGGWVQLIFILGQIGMVVWFFIVGFGPMTAFIHSYIEEEKEKEKAEAGCNSEIPEIPQAQPQAQEAQAQAPKPQPPRKAFKNEASSIETNSKTMMTNDKLTSPSVPSLVLNRAATKFELNGPTKLTLKDEEKPCGTLMKTKTMEPSSVLKISATIKDEELTDDDLNGLPYEDARRKDTRPWWKFYLQILLDTLSFTKPFMDITPIEPLQVRLIGFILMLGFYLALNAMFYDDSYVEARYSTNKTTGFLYLIQNEIEKSVYASLCSCLLNFLINYAIGFKKVCSRITKGNLNEKDNKVTTKKIIKNIKIRLIIFLVIQFIVMFFFWYYVSAFCAMYQANQGPLFISAVLTVVLCAVWEALISLCVTFLRYIGMRCQIPILYNISQYLL